MPDSNDTAGQHGPDFNADKPLPSVPSGEDKKKDKKGGKWFGFGGDKQSEGEALSAMLQFSFSLP